MVGRARGSDTRDLQQLFPVSCVDKNHRYRKNRGPEQPNENDNGTNTNFIIMQIFKLDELCPSAGAFRDDALITQKSRPYYNNLYSKIGGIF